jgi:hypothetical protein
MRQSCIAQTSSPTKKGKVLQTMQRAFWSGISENHDLASDRVSDPRRETPQPGANPTGAKKGGMVVLFEDTNWSMMTG